ncbi:cellulose binding domain-containing protein [Actinomadura pelletieri DSM 43383]|uniref:Cellulose binding domain-containing protein n=1 Tax=Actinomadura pelletieri DSM 43383 TaxID=1120940 RepID=A0A495QQ27_9ACTN|nr:cellulose binding domain-containing protein [Actinomadura pelletieri DSM 43383]
MSREEPGYTPPDHRTTDEFHVPDTITDPRDAGPGPESTVIDEPVDSGATLQDVPPDVTLQDPPVDDVDEPRDLPSATVADIAVPPGATAAEAPTAEETASDPATLPDEPERAVMREEAPWTAQFGAGAEPAPLGGTVAPSVADIAVPPGATAAEASTAEETVSDPATLPDEPERAVMREEAPWTARFGAGAEPAPPGGAEASADAPTQPAEASTPPPFDATAPAMPPLASPSGGVPPSRSRRPLLFVLIGVVVLLVVAAVAMVLVTRNSETEEKASPARSSAPAAPEAPAPATSGGSNPSEAPASPPQPGGPTEGTPAQPPASPAPAVSTAPIGPLLEGDGITYQLAQQDEGYFEGRMVITNRTDRPMRTWRLTFRVPGANVKNIWGARLVRGGENAEIGNLDGAPAIPPGGTWEIQFGAAGATSTPQACLLDGRPCGF